MIYICRTHIEGQSLIEGRFPHRGQVSSQIKGRIIFRTSRAKSVIYARAQVVSFLVTLEFLASKRHAHNKLSSDQDGYDYSSKDFVERKISQCFQMKRVLSSALKVFHSFLLLHIRILFFKAIKTIISKMKHLYNYTYKTKIELKFKLKDRSHTVHAFVYFLIVIVISHACIFETKL